MKKVEGSAEPLPDWLLDMIDAFHNFHEGFFQKQPPRLLFMTVVF